MIKNIQVLRGLAALMVVLHHLQDVMAFYLGLPFKLEFGTAGVDIFFVISGFVMTYAMQTARRSPAEFWRDRAIRILPLYWLATLLVVALVGLGYAPAGAKITSLDHVLKSLLLISYPAGNDTSPVLYVGWTLVYEAYFYLVFGLLLFLGPLKRVIAGLTLLFALSIGLYFSPARQSFYVATYGNPILLEFLAGVFVAAAYERLSSEAWRPWLDKWGRGLAIGLVVASVVAMGAYDAMPPAVQAVGHVAYFLVPAVALVGGALLAEKTGLVVHSRTLILIGAASYALYLFHPFLIQPTVKVVSKLAGTGPWVMAMAAVAAIVAALAAAIAIHLYVEWPVIAFLKGLFRPRTDGQVSRVLPEASRPE
jgi:peptidoglycan/LPS O-acetylase OafA/YrhL